LTGYPLTNKVIVIDDRTVLTSSFNFSKARQQARKRARDAEQWRRARY
jgi:hypothetical protein